MVFCNGIYYLRSLVIWCLCTTVLSFQSWAGGTFCFDKQLSPRFLLSKETHLPTKSDTHITFTHTHTHTQCACMHAQEAYSSTVTFTKYLRQGALICSPCHPIRTVPGAEQQRNSETQEKPLFEHKYCKAKTYWTNVTTIPGLHKYWKALRLTNKKPVTDSNRQDGKNDLIKLTL